MPSVFTRIVNNEIPSYKIYENDNFIVILDAFPIVKGHTLVIPKKEIDKIMDLDDATYSELFGIVRKIGRAIEKAIPCNRVSVQVIGLEVPHTHVHLIPINAMNDCDFKNEKLKLSPEEFQEIVQKITSKLDE